MVRRVPVVVRRVVLLVPVLVVRLVVPLVPVVSSPTSINCGIHSCGPTAANPPLRPLRRVVRRVPGVLRVVALVPVVRRVPVLVVLPGTS